METLRKNLVDTINELNKLLHEAISEEEKNQIRKKRRLYFTLLEEVIDQEIPASTDGFDDAIAALQDATKKAKEAKNDLSKVAGTIQKVADAAKQVEKIVKIGIEIIA